jgi:hypothetical protein
MEVLKDNRITARKKHVCNLCRFAINPGEKYRSAKMFDGGEFWEWKEHLECSECAKDTLDAEEYEEVVTWAGIEWREHMREWRESKKGGE